MKIIKNLALIVCTRNRPTEIKNFFDLLSNLMALPKIIVLVDSSNPVITQSYDLIKNQKEIDFYFIESSPGLPYQRSLGWDLIKSLQSEHAIDCVSFLDDDTHIEQNYFLELEKWVSINRDFIGVTGIPLEISEQRGKKIKRFFSLYTSESGVVLKSGFAGLPILDGNTDWMPGLCMNINPKFLLIESFKSDIRLYCEDIEMSLRLRQHGTLKVNSKLIYSHQNSQQNRENECFSTKYTLGMNYWMAKNKYFPLKRRYVIWSAFGILIMGIASGIFREKRFHRARGSVGFLINLLLRKQLVQKIKLI
jgi:GT2 family glycosyltransferase